MGIDKNFGIQELYELKIKATSNMKIGERIFSADETVLYFENAELVLLEEDVKLQGAFGGQYGSNLVLWRNLSNVKFGIDKGVLSELDLSLLLNAKIVEEENIVISKRQSISANSDGIVTLDFTPAPGLKLFAYKLIDDTYEKVIDGTIIDNTIDFGIANAFQYYIVDYSFVHPQTKSYFIANKKLPGMFKIEAKTRLKDDADGMEKTGIIIIPNMQLTSGMNFILGSKANPLMGNFMFTSISTPNVDKKQSASADNSVYNIYILDTDIDAI